MFAIKYRCTFQNKYFLEELKMGHFPKCKMFEEECISHFQTFEMCFSSPQKNRYIEKKVCTNTR